MFSKQVATSPPSSHINVQQKERERIAEEMFWISLRGVKASN